MRPAARRGTDMRTRAPANDLEREFEETLIAHRSEFEAAYKKIIDLSDKYGIPVGTHVPSRFKTHFFWDKENDTYGVDLEWVGRLLRGLVDQDFWQSSTNRCEMF